MFGNTIAGPVRERPELAARFGDGRAPDGFILIGVFLYLRRVGEDAARTSDGDRAAGRREPVPAKWPRQEPAPAPLPQAPRGARLSVPVRCRSSSWWCSASTVARSGTRFTGFSHHAGTEDLVPQRRALAAFRNTLKVGITRDDRRHDHRHARGVRAHALQVPRTHRLLDPHLHPARYPRGGDGDLAAGILRAARALAAQPPTVIFAHITFCISFVIVVVKARLSSFDERLIEAAADLGATPFQTFLRVMLPLAAPGIAAGAMLAFTISLDDVVITFFTSGVGSTTLPLYIFGQLKFGVSPGDQRAVELCAVLLPRAARNRGAAQSARGQARRRRDRRDGTRLSKSCDEFRGRAL